MKKLRKIVTGLICAVMTFSSILPIYAVEARYPVKHCPQCYTGAVTSHEVGRKGLDQITLCLCPHGGKGYDMYLTIQVTIEDICNECPYTKTFTREERKYVYCVITGETQI